MKWMLVSIAVALIGGCNRVTEADVKAAREDAARTLPAINPCGGRLLTEAELQRIVPGSTRFRGKLADEKFMYNGQVVDLWAKSLKRKYVLTEFAICEMEFNGSESKCSFYGKNSSGFYRIARSNSFLPTDIGRPQRVYFGCEKVTFNRDN